MTQPSGSRQEQILNLLLAASNGLSIDELAVEMQISRNAVKQHLVGLEKEQLVAEAALNSTGGRPARSYKLTELGRNRLPKQYGWFCTLLLAELKSELGEAALRQMLARMGVNLAQSLAPQFNGKDPAAKRQTLVELMQTLGYRAELETENGQLSLKAVNCVYHDLAQQFPELCEFDRALIGTLLESPIEQTACMAQQDCACRFRICAGER
ncbi:HTH domain-containing protein [Methylomonas sp. EFPC3]|uniref:helix-turn-helix transcriptional regulator n=1 Tax=Methylomonas TaxID=416 RepID=UPI001126C8A9|nr:MULTISPECIES: HTH domain-containing protein [Methylomonas]TPQ29567.1 ArsR family transcriptional regulator [Methylomonas koyamae]WFP50690.1 HTH domain-containing protein [Methylomonas sp. EFPC3]